MELGDAKVGEDADGKLNASGSHDKSVKVWDLEKGQVVTVALGVRTCGAWRTYMKLQDRPENVYF